MRAWTGPTVHASASQQHGSQQHGAFKISDSAQWTLNTASILWPHCLPNQLRLCALHSEAKLAENMRSHEWTWLCWISELAHCCWVTMRACIYQPSWRRFRQGTTCRQKRLCPDSRKGLIRWPIEIPIFCIKPDSDAMSFLRGWARKVSQWGGSVLVTR